MNSIEFNGVWKEYGDNIVLENLNLKVNAGEFVTLVGASGCGKTTFLKMLLGTESPSRGAILLDGKPISEEPGADRGIVFQRYSVYPHLNVLENVMLGLEMKKSPLLGRTFGKTRRQIKQKAMEMLELVGLSHALEQYPTALSGGMQQRLAIAQALVMEPEILLLDEPFGALDPGIRSDMHALILEIWKKTRLTVFMITHDLHEGFYLGTRLFVFDKLRHDPDSPNRYGASITFDIPVAKTDDDTYRAITESVTI